MVAEVRRRVRRFSWRAARGSLIGATVLLAIGLVLPATAGAVTLQVPDEPVVLEGSGADGAQAMALDWARAFYDSEAGPTVDFLGTGEAEGRRAFVEGRSDYFISGTPLSDATRAELAKGDGVISAPIHGAALAVLLAAPYGRPFKYCDAGYVFDLDEFDIVCDSGFVGARSVLDGTPGRSLKMHTDALAAAFTFRLSSNLWQTPSFLAQAVPGDCETRYDPAEGYEEGQQPDPCKKVIRQESPGGQAPSPLVRSDGSAENLYFQQYFKLVAPEAWRKYLASVRANLVAFDAAPEWTVDVAAGTDTYPIGERWVPDPITASRSGDDQVVSTMQSALDPRASRVPAFGKVTFAHPQSAREAMAAEDAPPPAFQTRPPTELWMPQLHNAAGEWVSPTPRAITASIAAGEGKALYGATNAVPGGWPLTWVDEIHFPARGLSVDQTNTAAAVLRYQATVGREKAESFGDGRLTDAMAARELAAANEVVSSNCAAAGADVVQEVGAGPYTPKGQAAVFEALGSVSWCRARPDTPPPTSTTLPFAPTPDDLFLPETVVEPLADAGLAFDSGFEELPVTDDPPPVVEDPPVAEEPAVAESAPAVDESGADEEEPEGVATIAAEMPMSLPGTESRAMDRIATLALGGAIFLALRALWRGGIFHRAAGVGP